ncbi:DUF2066 domain-containing protein [Thalassotalea maritima]|uniref:DUF2066 domain-containing protein n=1 Tax=Thalassotalea maritima TaxID=3242416 RepID=UPI0035299DF0
MKLKKTLRPLIIGYVFALCAVLQPLHAIEIADLYEGKVALDVDAADQNIAYQQALRQVLIKLAGRESVESNNSLKRAVSDAQNYLSGYRFSSVDGQNYLFATFESAKVDTLLQQSQASIWGKYRPLITIWMIDEQGNDRQMIADSHPLFSQQIKQAFAQRGIKVNFPLMDLTDAMDVSVDDVWGRFADNIQRASARYMAEAVMVLRVSDSTLVEEPDIAVCGQLCAQQSVASDWLLWGDELLLQNKRAGNDKLALLDQVVDDVAEALHQKFGVIVNSQNRFYVDIEIVNVSSMKTFVAVRQLFASLNLVSDVTLIRAEGDTMLFRLQTMADNKAIMQALSLESNLLLNHDPLAELDKQQPVSFFWKG